MRRWLPWGALAVLLAVALTIGAGRSGSATPAQRVSRITAELRCPTCRGLSVAESDAKAAIAIKNEVIRQVADGRTDGQIEAYMVDRYGRDILLRPQASGFDALVWALPVMAFVVAVAALVFAFRRWHRLGAET